MATFASHPKAKYWSDRNALGPHEVALNSHKKFWFDCDCGHEFESSLLNINQANNWCPYCCVPSQKLCDDNKCMSCYNKSFASHEKSQYWCHDNELMPRQVFKGADRKKFKFNCDKCCHIIVICLKDITSKGRWCAYCSHQKLCDNIECEICFTNSFASVERNKYLHDKTINPRMLFKRTNKKYYPTLKCQYKVDWCKNLKHLPYDFVIEEHRIIIELDGKQHFTPLKI